MELEILESFANTTFLSSYRAFSRIISDGHMPLASLCTILGAKWRGSADIQQYSAITIIMIKNTRTVSITVTAVRFWSQLDTAATEQNLSTATG